MWEEKVAVPAQSHAAGQAPLPSQDAEPERESVRRSPAAIEIKKLESSLCNSGLTSASDETNTRAEQEDEESESQRLDRLGRARPERFQSVRAELGFCYSIIASEFMAEYFISGFNVILPTLIHDLDIPQAAAVWPASAFTLVSAAFLLPLGRLADMYGGYPVYLAGLAWFLLWSLITGFSKTQLMLNFCRALSGLGPAAFLPAGIMLIGTYYRPGPRKNMVFSIYGAAAPLGFFAGVFFAGLTGSFLNFGVYFWVGAGLIATTIVAAIWSIPNDSAERRRDIITMDWPGSILIVLGLILFIFAITEASHAPKGWKTTYILVTLISGILLLIAAIFLEGWFVPNPLLPSAIFKVPYISPLLLSLLFTDGILGVFLVYGILYIQDCWGATPLQVAAWFIPMISGGIIIAVLGGYILHLIPGTILIIIGGLSWIATSLLLALAPVGASYWAFIFPAMIFATMAMDITFNVTNIFISTSLPHAQQGMAGALVMTQLFLGIAFCLAFADVTQTNTAHLGLRESYQAVFWYQLGCAVLALGIVLGFVRIRRAESELTVDERLALESQIEQRPIEWQTRN